MSAPETLEKLRGVSGDCRRIPLLLSGRATDALCSVNDATHDALLLLYRARFSQQIATVTREEILHAWDR